MNGSLNFIYKQQKELSTLGGVAALLGWDQMTYMPKNGAIERSEQNALISKLSHQRVISDEFWNHIEYLTKEETFEKLEAKDKAVVKRLKIDVEKARKVPTEFVEKMTKITTIAYQKWEEARNINDFKVFLPYFEKIVDLEKEYCSFTTSSNICQCIQLPYHPHSWFFWWINGWYFYVVWRCRKGNFVSVRN